MKFACDKLIHINSRKKFFWKYLSEKSVVKFIDKSQKHKIQELIDINNRKKKKSCHWLTICWGLYTLIFWITLAFSLKVFLRQTVPVSSLIKVSIYFWEVLFTCVLWRKVFSSMFLWKIISFIHLTLLCLLKKSPIFINFHFQQYFTCWFSFKIYFNYVRYLS